MIRRIVFKPPGFAMMRTRSMSKYQQYKATPKSLRLEITVKPKDSSSLPVMGYSFGHQNYEKTFTGTFMDEFPMNICLEKKDLDEDGHLHLELMLVCIDQLELLRKETFDLSIDTSKQEHSEILKRGNTEVEVVTRIIRDQDVKFRDVNQLCNKEEEFVTKRKRVVFDNMKKTLQFKTSLEGKDESKVPNIAVIGSGGGMRAVLGMCGSILGLQKSGILDYAMYTAGLSGSAWYLTTLYAYDKELNPSINSVRTVMSLQNVHLQNFFKGQFNLWKILRLTFSYGLQNNFNLTKEFGISLGDIFLKEKSVSKWSEQTKKLEDGMAPLPLIAALHVRPEKGTDDYHEWIELSPYEVFIPKYGAAIDMENFGDEFYGGFVTKRNGEKPIEYLQGMCGSAYAIVRKYTLSESKWSVSVVRPWMRSIFNFFDHTFVGRVPNFLRGITRLDPLFDDIDSRNDVIDTEEKSMLLIDAGLAFNSPYPVVLHPSRKVDIILSFDFSDRGNDYNWPFKQLEKAALWAEKRQIPFPELKSKLKEIRDEFSKEGNYKEVYVFPGVDDSPTVVHFVMINNSFGKTDFPSHSEFEILPDYATRKFGYSIEESNKFVQLCLFNVITNRNQIYDCIKSVIDKKK